MKKKISTLFLVFAFVLPCLFLLTACGDDEVKATSISVELNDTEYTMSNNEITIEWGEHINFTSGDFKIVATFEDGSTQDLSEKTSTTEGYTFTSNLPTGEGQTEVGDYTLTFGYQELENTTIKIHIIKRVMDLGTLTWNADEFTYDGTEKTVFLEADLSDFIIINYEGNKATDAGDDYLAIASITCLEDNHYSISPARLEKHWKINKANKNTNSVQLKSSVTFAYTGEEQELTVDDLDNIPPEVTVEIAGENKGTNVGDYTAILKFTYTGEDKDNFNAIPDKELTWKIDKAQSVIVDGTQNISADYNGSAHCTRELLMTYLDFGGASVTSVVNSAKTAQLSFDNGNTWINFNDVNFADHAMKEAGQYYLGYKFTFENYEDIVGLKTVTINPTYAKVGNTYSTLVDAVKNVANNQTIVLCGNVEEGGLLIGEGSRTFTIDLGGYSYKCVENPVGSQGYETQALHFEKGNIITIKNGTIACASDSGVKMLVQNYCNLTLDGVTLDGANVDGKYVMSNNFGDVTIKGSTINAGENQVAFDVWYGANAGGLYDNGVSVTVDKESTINGAVEFGAASRTALMSTEAKLVMLGTWSTKKLIISGNVNLEKMIIISNNEDDALQSNYSMFILNDGNMDFDLDGKTLKIASDYTYDKLFLIKSGTIVIKNGTINAEAKTQSEIDPVVAEGTADVTLQNMLITIDNVTGACVYARGNATIKIESGTYQNITTQAYPYRDGYDALVVNQANDSIQRVFISGGTFKGCNPDNGDDSGLVTTFLRDGYKAVEDDDSWQVVEEQ